MAFALVVSTGGVLGKTTPKSTTGVDTSGATFLAAVVVTYTFGAGSLSNPDSKGNNWTALTAKQSQAGNSAKVQIFYCASPVVGASHTITIAGSSDIYCCAWFMAFSGGLLVSPFDLEAGTGSSTGTTIHAGSGVTPSLANELIISGLSTEVLSGTPAVSNLTGAVQLSGASPQVGGVNFGGGAAYAIQTTAALADPIWTVASSAANAAVIACFKAAVVSPLLRPPTLSGIGSGGPFFQNPLN